MLNLSGQTKTIKRAIMATFLATFLILSGISGISEVKAENGGLLIQDKRETIKYFDDTDLIDSFEVNELVRGFAYNENYILVGTDPNNGMGLNFYNHDFNLVEEKDYKVNSADYNDGIFYIIDKNNKLISIDPNNNFSVNSKDVGGFMPLQSVKTNDNYIFTGGENLTKFDKDFNKINEVMAVVQDIELTDNNIIITSGSASEPVQVYDYDLNKIKGYNPGDDFDVGGHGLKVERIGDYFFTSHVNGDVVKHNIDNFEPVDYINDLQIVGKNYDKLVLFDPDIEGNDNTSNYDIDFNPINTFTGVETVKYYGELLEYEKPETEPFDGFEAFNLQPEEYSLNEYFLNAEVLDFGSYDFEESDNLLARGIEIFNSEGEVINSPPMEIIDDFETPAEFDYLFTAEDGESYGYRWRFAYIDYITGQTIDTYRTSLDTFSHQVDEEAPDIETEPATDINDDSAELRGQVNDLGDSNNLNISFEWAEKGAEDWNETDTVATLDNSYNYPATVWEIIDDLEKETTYNFRIKANDYRGNVKTFTTSAEPIDEPDPPPPEDWNDWPDFYDLQADDEFSEPVGVIDTIGGTFHGMMNAITSRIEPFSDQIETDKAFNYGKEAGEFIPTMRGYLIELRPFFGGLPVAEVFLFFLIFEVAILGIKGVMIALGFLPFF